MKNVLHAALTHLTPEIYLSLASGVEPPCVSITLPSHSPGTDPREPKAKLKNLLRDAEERLIERGMRPTTAKDLLEPGRALLEDDAFWMPPGKAIALFLAHGTARVFRLNIGLTEGAAVNSRFHLKPLVPLLSPREFHILALSLNRVRLLHCTETEVERVELPEDVATSFVAATGEGTDEHDERGVWRHGGGVSGGNRLTDAHGPGPDLARERQEDLAFYMRQLDEGITRVIGPQATLVLAAAESTWPAFKLASQRRSILDEVIDGNPDRTPDEELRLKGVHLMTPRWQRELNQLAQRYEDALAHRLGSAELAEIVQAASEGRIETLFVVPSASVAGTYDPIHHQATVTDTGDDDLVDLAVLLTVKTSGRLIVVEKTPGGGPAAAIYRY